MVIVYSKCKTIPYYSTICSDAFFFMLITTIVSIGLPFIVLIDSNGFWLKRDSFHEQPDIKFKHEYIFLAETNHLNTSIVCSNVVGQQIENKEDKCAKIEIREIDHNRDGVNDEFHFSLTLDQLNDLYIKTLNLILTFDYRIHTICPLHMQTAILLQKEQDEPSVKINFVGDVVLKQSSPLVCQSEEIFDKYNQSIINTHQNQNFDLWDFIKELTSRTVSLKTTNSYTIWKKSSTSRTFQLEIQLKYPEQRVTYRPNIWQVMKFAWIQYYAIFVLIVWFVNKIRNYVFTYDLVSVYKFVKCPKIYNYRS